jgi:hypothetical protein
MIFEKKKFSKMPNFMKIRADGAELVSADRQIDMTILIVAV